MKRNTNEWLDRKVADWTSKGWISEEVRKKIQDSYGRDEQKGPLLTTLPLYALLAVIGLAAAGLALVWGAALIWYQVSLTVRIVLAAVLLAVTQLGVGTAMFQERQGTLIGEGVALVHCMGVFAVLALAEQSFYIGWDVTAYVAVCAFLCLPVVYLLRSAAALIVYDAALLYWTAAGGPLNTFGGTALLWIFLLLVVPFYNTLITTRDERRLAVFSWATTITVFAAFGLAAKSTDYIPFLMLGSLAVTIMLVGYSIDIRQSWGTPFRWFGRCAAAGSLLISCVPAAWDGIARVHSFHWATAVVTVILFGIMGFLMARTVKERFWGPILYLAIPFILAFETVLVRAGLYSSVPLVLSSLYMVVLCFFETSQGFKPGRSIHMKFGAVLFVALILTFIFATDFSPLAPLLAILVLALIVFQFRRMQQDKKAAAQRAARRAELRQSASHVRAAGDTEEGSVLPQAETPAWQVRDAEQEADSLASWMKQNVHIPTPEELGIKDAPEEEKPIFQFKEPDFAALAKAAAEKIEKAEKAEKAERAEKAEKVEKVEKVEKAEKAEKAERAERAEKAERAEAAELAAPQPMPQQMAVPTAAPPEETKRPAGSPWSQMKPAPKRQKHFTQSPWSHEGGKTK